MKLSICFHFIIFSILVSCVEQPPSSNKYTIDEQFSERKRVMSYERVMKELPNIVDLRETFFLSVDGKLSELDVSNISVELHERPGGRILYKGSLLGIMTMPRNRVRIPVSSNEHQIFGKFTNLDGKEIISSLKRLSSGEVVIRSEDFSRSSFQK